MLPAVFLACCIAAAAVVGRLLWTSFKQDIARVFTEDYAEIRRAHPHPLHSYRFVSGRLRTKTVLPFRFRGRPLEFPNALHCRATLRLDLHPDMLVVSTMGQALRLPYARRTFKHEQCGFLHTLSVENLPVREKPAAERFPNPVDFDTTTTLTLQLGKGRIARIEALAVWARGGG